MRCRLVAMILLAMLGSADLLWAADSNTSARAAPTGQSDVIPKQWLDQEVSVEQAEAQHMVAGIPFGASSEDWKRLKSRLEVGDSLWTYCSPFESFKAHAGRCGIAVVRSGKVVLQLVTLMN
jgi:hypothetical protein